MTIPEVTVVGDLSAGQSDPEAPTSFPGDTETTPGNGGFSEASEEGDGGFTPAPGARSQDPEEGGSSQLPPDGGGGFTPGTGTRSFDPEEGGSTQGPITIPEVTVEGDPIRAGVYQIGFKDGQNSFPTNRAKFKGNVEFLIEYDQGFADGTNAPREDREVGPPQKRPPQARSLSDEDFERDRKSAEEFEENKRELEEFLELKRELDKETSQENPDHLKLGRGSNNPQVPPRVPPRTFPRPPPRGR